MRALLVTCLWLLAGCESLTYVVVRIDSTDLNPPELASIRITVTNPELAGAPVTYQSNPLRLCSAGERTGCYTFPISVTLAPGEAQPGTKVRVAVDAFDAAGAQVIADASVFSFTEGASKAIDFFLFRTCLQSTCAALDLACGPSGGCRATGVRDEESAPPDFAVPASSGEVRRISVAPGINTVSPLQVPPPATEAGDLVVVGIFTGTAWNTGASPGWQLFGQVNYGSVVLYRIAQGDERDDPAPYTFALPMGAIGNGYVVVTYRGAGRLRAGTSGDTPIVFTGVPDLRAGGLVAGMFTAAIGQCTDDELIDKVVNTGAWSVFEVAPMLARTGVFDLPCSQTGSVYHLVVEP